MCKSETAGKIGEADEMGERELVLVVSVRCGKGRDMTLDFPGSLIYWMRGVSP